MRACVCVCVCVSVCVCICMCIWWWCFLFTQSCPPIQVYTPSNIDRGLDAAANNFVSQEVTVDKEARKVSAYSWH